MTARALLRTAGLVCLVGGVATCDPRSSGEEGGGGPPAPVWSAERTLRIGAVDDPEYAFGHVGDLAVGPGGALYTLHPQEGEVRRWTPSGAPAGRVGGVGEGPGEFSAPWALGFAGDTLWVFDERSYRILHFAPDGTFLSAATPDVEIGSVEQFRRGEFPPRPQAPFRDGSLYGRTPTWTEEVAGGRLTEVVHVRMGEGGEPADTLAVTPIGPSAFLVVPLPGGGSTSSEQPFGDAPLTEPTADGEGLLVLERDGAGEEAAGPAYRLTRVDLAGDTVFSRRYPFRPVRLDPASVDSAGRARAAWLASALGERTGLGEEAFRARVGRALHVPARHPPVTAVVSGRDGTVWLAENPPVREGRPWLVLDGGGEPVGRVVLPAGLRLLAAAATAVWGVETDALDVAYVVRYEVERR